MNNIIEFVENLRWIPIMFGIGIFMTVAGIGINVMAFFLKNSS